MQSQAIIEKGGQIGRGGGWAEKMTKLEID